MSINWHTKSQGPKTKCVNFSRGRIDSYLAHSLTVYCGQNCEKNCGIFFCKNCEIAKNCGNNYEKKVEKVV